MKPSPTSHTTPRSGKVLFDMAKNDIILDEVDEIDRVHRSGNRYNSSTTSRLGNIEGLPNDKSHGDLSPSSPNLI
jgi:hypothetical protein